VLLVVCDSFGIGGAPDAALYGDEGSNTLGNCARAVGGIHAPNLASLGLGLLADIPGVEPRAEPGTLHGRLTERSAGKDSTTGHWEMAGVVLERPFPTYPDGLPAEVIKPFEEAIGRGVIGGEAASGTEIIARLGEEHLRTAKPIVYTSGDSVFQVACHEDVAPVETLYDWCLIARRLLDGEHRVGRVIARPFTGTPGSFRRTAGRRDFSVEPPQPTLLDQCVGEGVAVFGVGKIGDVFAGRGLTEYSYSKSNDHGIDLTLGFAERPGPSLVFANLVDFDTTYGHRNDPRGYAGCVEAFDRRIPELVSSLHDGVLFVTGDHGCDPTTAPTDHSRERVPVLGSGFSGPAIDLDVRSSFADLGASVAELLGIRTFTGAGESFADRLALPDA
jgi:phosphopentomutase